MFALIASTQQTTMLDGYIEYGAGDFDGQNSGHDFYGVSSRAQKAFLRSFPRHYGWGVALLTIDFFWSMMVLSNMDMGEFFFLRKWFLTLVPIGFVLVLIYVKEFLSVRALGSLMLLVSGVVLAAAFLQPPVTRLLLPVLAYAWIISGMFFVGMPFLMRDWTTWLLAKEGRWSLVVWGGIGYGAALLVLAVLTY